MRYMHIYMLIDISTVPAMVYMRHASHLQARGQNGEHFVYSKLIVKRSYSRWLYIAFLKYALKYT